MQGLGGDGVRCGLGDGVAVLGGGLGGVVGLGPAWVPRLQGAAEAVVGGVAAFGVGVDGRGDYASCRVVRVGRALAQGVRDRG